MHGNRAVWHHFHEVMLQHLREYDEPGMNVSLVARKHGVGASQLFNWRKLEREGALTAVTAGESVVPASELAAARAQIAQLQRIAAHA